MAYQILFVFSALVLNAYAQQIYMYEHKQYEGFRHFAKITTSCETIPYRYSNSVTAIDTDKCVILYSHPDCSGSSYRLEAGDYPELPHFYDETDSFRACDDLNEESPFRDLRTKFYEHSNFGNVLIDLPVSQKCQDLPDWAWDQASSIKTDVCVVLYSESGCYGKSFQVEAGSHSDLPYFGDDANSFQPCDENQLLKDYRLTVNIHKFELTEGSTGTPGEDDLDMGATQSFRNNGSATIVQRYSVSKDILEVVELERVVGTKDFHRFYVDADVSFSYSAGIPFIAQTKLSASLKTGYLFEKTREENITTRYRNETRKVFKVEQDISVPPCTVYEVSSSVKLSTNYPVDYVAHAYVTGEYTGHQLTENELRSRLDSDMTYVGTVDGNTVEVIFNRTLKAGFGLSTETKGDGYPIEGCLLLEDE